MDATAHARDRLHGVVRAVTVVALAAALSAVALVMLDSGSSYTLNAEFLDAGQLVTGGRVEVAGRPVGSIARLTLTPNGLADVRLSISDPRYVPLHAGTRALIRAVGLAGVTNRYVDLVPGPGFADALPSGSVLRTDHTDGIVDLDSLIDAFTPSTRAAAQGLIAHSAEAFAGSGARYFNAVLARLSPALAQTARMSGELAGDRTGLARLVTTTARAASAIAARRPDLEHALENTASTLGAVAAARPALDDDLSRLPDVVRRAMPVLTGLRSVLVALRPDLASIPPAATPLASALARLTPTASRLRPVTEHINRLLPALDSALGGLPALAPPATAALSSTTSALRKSMHIFQGLREYGADLAIGVFAGLAGTAAAPYDRVGHYVRLQLMLSPQANVIGLLGSFLEQLKLFPGLSGIHTSVAPCPGGGAPPAPDHSNPWIPDRSICNPADDRR